MYQALITDLDGSAVPIASDGSHVSDSTRDAVREAEKVGKKIACATGRQWQTAKPVVQALGITEPCVIEGGTRIIDPVRETTVWEKALEREDEAAILRILKEEATGGRIMDSDNPSNRPLTKETQLPDGLRFVYVLDISQDQADAIQRRITNETGAVAHYTPSWFGDDRVDIHVTHREATKQHAIEEWQQLQGISKEQTIGLGDSGNDIPIFHASGLKVAAGNATSDLKKLADVVTATAEDGALEQTIRDHLLMPADDLAA